MKEILFVQHHIQILHQVFFINVNCNSQALTRSKGLEKHPILKSKGQFLLTKIIWSRWLVCNQHQWSALRILTIRKTSPS
jgi:hypothetical protein